MFKLVKDYDYDIRYYLGITIIIIGDLSRKVILSQIIAYKELQQELVKE